VNIEIKIFKLNIPKINMPSSLHTSNVGSELGALQRQGRFVVGAYATENTKHVVVLQYF
jgi:hypothetical protein